MGFTILAVISLVPVIVLLPIWISHAFPPPFWMRFSVQPINTAQESFSVHRSTNMLVFEHARHTPRIVGPLASNLSAADAFRRWFGSPAFSMNFVRFKTMSGPVFATGKDGRIGMIGTSQVYLVPYGLLIAAFAILPAWRWLPGVIRRVRSRLAPRPGFCKKCGYDLRASPDRCPECGLPAAVEVR